MAVSCCHACMHVSCRHSGPQGKVVPLTIIDDPADWKSRDWEGREAEYTYSLTAQDVAELHSAVAALKKRGVAAEHDIIAVRLFVHCVTACCIIGDGGFDVCAQKEGTAACCTRLPLSLMLRAPVMH